MKKLFFIVWFIACTNVATIVLPSPAESPVEQLVRVMMSNTKHESPSLLARERKPTDYQDVYNLATKHSEILKGIIHDGRTFAFLCYERGYADLLTNLIKEGYPVDLATPCNECGLHNPQTTVLHKLFSSISILSRFKKLYADYLPQIKELAELIIIKYPNVLDTSIDREMTARQYARQYYQEYLIINAINKRLLDACKNWDLKTVQALITTSDVRVNRTDEHGCTPLLIAAQQRNLQLLEVLLSLKKSDGSYAANVNQSNKDGVTPLLAACQDRNLHMVERLLTVAGIEVNKADNNGNTPLIVACKNNSANLSLNIIDLLLNNGATNKENNEGETPLEITKGSSIHGRLELALTGEVRASKYNTALSKEEAKRFGHPKLSPKTKEGIAFHE